MWMHVHLCMHAGGRQKITSGFVPLALSPFFDSESLTGLELAKQARQAGQAGQAGSARQASQ